MCVITLSISSVLSIRYYIKAKDLAPHLRKLDDVKNEINDKNKDLASLRREKVAAERTIEQEKEAKKWMADTRNEMINLKQQAIQARADANTANAELNRVNKDLNDKRQALADCNSKRDETEKARNDAQNRLTAIQTEYADVKVMVTALKAEKSVLTLEVAKLEKTASLWMEPLAA